MQFIDTSHDIIQAILQVANSKLSRPVSIFIGQGVEGQHGAPALTLFPDDGSDPEIYIDGDIPYVAVAELLCHELAHCIHPEDDHGKLWEEANEKLWKDAVKVASKTDGTQLPQYVFLQNSEDPLDEEGTALRLVENEDGRLTYYRDAGAWDLIFEIVDGELIAQHIEDGQGRIRNDSIKGMKLVPTTKEKWENSNYSSTIDQFHEREKS